MVHRNPESGEDIIVRHADKGSWKVDEQELRAQVPGDVADTILLVLRNDFPNMSETSLKLDGLVRSVRLGDTLFNRLADHSVLVVTDSGKDRAQLTKALVTTRIHMRENAWNKEHPDEQKRIDMIAAEGDDVARLMADSHPDTWPPYAQMMKDEGISESEALVRWLHDMNRADASVPPDQAPKESAERYRALIQSIRGGVTSEQVPVTLLGVGHSGSLAQIKHEDAGRELSAKDMPQFCEMFQFDESGKLQATEEVEIT